MSYTHLYLTNTCGVCRVISYKTTHIWRRSCLGVYDWTILIFKPYYMYHTVSLLPDIHFYILHLF